MELTEVHAWGDGTLSDAIGTIHEVGSVLKLAVPVDASTVRHFVEDIYDELITAVDFDQRTWELPCQRIFERSQHN